MKTESVESRIRERIHDYYWNWGYNCATSTLLTLSDLLEVPVHEQVIRGAAGLHGAGGYRAQCGLVEGALIFIGIFAAREGRAEEVPDLCYNFARSFEADFGSLSCAGLRPGGFRDDDPPHLCETLTIRAVKFTHDYLESIR